jgi:hypothetical protein
VSTLFLTGLLKAACHLCAVIIFICLAPLTFPLQQVCLNFDLTVWSFDLVMERNTAFLVLNMTVNPEVCQV